jgi:integrase
MAPPAKHKIKITDQSVKSLDAGRWWDAEIGGFGVKVYPTGKRMFILRYRSPDKKQREFRVGQHGVVSADEARRKAKVLLAKIIEGADPQWDRKMELASAKTVGDVLDAYLRWAETHHKPSSLEQVQRCCRLQLRPRFGEFRCDRLTRGVVQRLYDRMTEAPHYRARIIDWGRSIWAWAERRELVGGQQNPFLIETGVQRKRRQRILSAEEYARLWGVLRSYRHRQVIPPATLWAIEMLMITPLRKTEAFRLRWENVRADEGVLLVTDHKTDHYADPLRLFITPPLADLLNRIAPSPVWLFPCPASKSGHVEAVDKAWTRIRQDARLYEGRARITLHDLRRSWTSVGAKLGYSPDAMGKVVGNSARVNADHYWHLDEAMRSDISERIAQAISGFSERQATCSTGSRDDTRH